MRLIKRLWTTLRSWISGRLRRDSASVRASRVEELPDELDGKTLYVVGGDALPVRMR
jgi:hypothetical protein